MENRNGFIAHPLSMCATIALLTLCPALAATDAGEAPRVEQADAVTVSPERAFYRWRDAQGRTHYGSQPPPGVAAEAVDMGGANMAVIEMAPVEAQPAAPARPQRRQSRKSSSGPSAAERRAARCAQIQERIRYIDSRLRAGYKAREGERLKDRRRALMKQRSEHCD